MLRLKLTFIFQKEEQRAKEKAEREEKLKIQAEEKAKRLQEKEELKRKKEEEKAKEEKKKEDERLAIEAKKKTEQNKFKSFFSRIVLIKYRNRFNLLAGFKNSKKCQKEANNRS